MKTKELIIVSIVEDDLTIGQSLKDYLNTLPQLCCDNLYNTAEEALEGIVSCRPDIVIMDIGLPEMNGVECLEHLLKSMPELKVLMFTVFDTDDLLFKALKAGASGYLLKDSSYEVVNTALKDLLAGGAPMSPAIAKKVIKSFRYETTNTNFQRLTDHQKNILKHISDGLLNKEIANILDIQVGTVKEQVRRIYKKLQVNNRVEASNIFRNSQ